MSKTSVRVKDGKTEVNFSRANSMNTPLCIMIPKLLVPVVKQLLGEIFRRVRKRPITPKWVMYTIEMIDHGLLNICVKVQGLATFSIAISCFRVIDAVHGGCLNTSPNCVAVVKCEVLPATPANTTASYVLTIMQQEAYRHNGESQVGLTS